MLELRRVGDEEALQKLAPVELQGCAKAAVPRRLREGDGITPERSLGQSQLFVSAADEGFRAEAPAQHVHRLAQGTTGALLIQVRPEETEEHVPPLEPVGLRDGEIHEERDPLGVCEDAPEFGSVGIPQVDRS